MKDSSTLGRTFRCSAVLDEDDDEAARLIAEESLLFASPRG